VSITSSSFAACKTFAWSFKVAHAYLLLNTISYSEIASHHRHILLRDRVKQFGLGAAVS